MDYIITIYKIFLSIYGLKKNILIIKYKINKYINYSLLLLSG